MAKQDVIVIHGGSCWSSYAEYLEDLKKTIFTPGASPSNNWHQSLPKSLGSRFRVFLPEMPNWQNAKYLEWKIWFEKILQASNSRPMVVGHSLGAIFLVKYFAEERVPKAVSGLFLVSAPFILRREDPGFGDFALRKIPAGLRQRGAGITFYHSEDDEIVTFDHLEKYQLILPGARFRVFKHRGHFRQKTFSELIRDLKAAAGEKN
jgi:predicted alpha/beta hydrolase family esterase